MDIKEEEEKVKVPSALPASPPISDSDSYDWGGHRVRPDAKRRTTKEHLNPTWKYFVLDHETGFSSCERCDYSLKTKDPAMLIPHLEEKHPRQMQDFIRKYNEYDKRRHKAYLPYRYSNGPNTSTKEEKPTAFDEEVPQNVLQELFSTSDQSDTIKYPVCNSLFAEPIEQNGLLAEAKKFNLMVKIAELLNGSFELHASISFYSVIDQKTVFNLLDTEPLDLSTPQSSNYFYWAVKQMLFRKQMKYRNITNSVVEGFSLTGLDETADIFPNQMPSYHDSLQKVVDKISELTNHYYPVKQQPVQMTLEEYQRNNPLVHYQRLLMDEINLTKTWSNSNINRILPFFVEFLDKLNEEVFDAATDLHLFVRQTMRYAFDPASDDFCSKFIESVFLSPGLVHYLTDDQFNHAKQTIIKKINLINLALQQRNPNCFDLYADSWTAELYNESKKLHNMNLEECLNYNHVEFWTHHREKYPDLFDLVTEFHAIPASVYICDS